MKEELEAEIPTLLLLVCFSPYARINFIKEFWSKETRRKLPHNFKKNMDCVRNIMFPFT